MSSRRSKFVTAAIAIVAGAAMFTEALLAYSSYAKWGTNSVTFYVNPSAAEVDAAGVESSLQAGMDIWNTQSGTAFRFQYGGRVNDTATTNDGRNVVIFRNESGGAIASTYSWWSGSTLVDSDIIFWDGPYTFFAGSSGCGGSNAAYIIDIAAHEFGHALGLNHSTVSDATMYPGYSTCQMDQRTLASDDIAGVQSLYSAASPNTAPSISIPAPSNNTSYTQGTSVSFSGSASDQQDGNLSSQLSWTSSIDGQIGSGAAFSRVLSVGTHTITASVTDSGGLFASKPIAVTITAPATPEPPASSGPTLRASAYKVKGLQRADLVWSGISESSVDIFRSGVKIKTTSNDAVETDLINKKGAGSYSYKVCAAGTSTCTNVASVTF